MSDRGYINLIRHLTRTTSTLPLETLQASIAHYLARPPVPVPGSPTALTATVLSSPLFRSYTHEKLTALSVAFRHAVHMRVAVLKEEAEKNPGGIFTRGVNVCAKLAKWCRAVLEGFSGSPAVVRLACSAGLLMGLEDWEKELKVKEKEARVRTKVEEEFVLVLAEVIDAYAREGSGWETDFKQTIGVQGEEDDPLTLAVLISSQCASFVAPQRLQALPLPTIVDVLTATIDRAFKEGTFLSAAPVAVKIDAQGKVAISPASTFVSTVCNVSSSIFISSMPSLARFTALTLKVLVESRRAHGWEAIGRTLTRLQALVARVDAEWTKCPLANVGDSTEFSDNESREVATAVWSILKTLLFTTLMVSQSILSAVVFIPSPHGQHASGTSSSNIPSPYAIALDILHTLSYLSFVLPQFGGVASTSEGGLPELKRAFYMALDVLSASESEANRFVEELCRTEDSAAKGKGVGNPPRTLADAKTAFALACVEQLIPVLPEATIQSRAYPLCLPHLWDPSHRETYESAHSVMLAIFAAHAQGTGTQSGHRAPEPAFAEKIVPKYVQCLIENASDGCLSTQQLCMAYAALVRSASSFGYAGQVSGDAHDETVQAADSMAWFCIEALLDALRHVSAASVRASLPYASEPGPPSGSATATGPARSHVEHIHRLRLALIATVPSVSLALLPQLLVEVKAAIVSVSHPSADHDAREEEMRKEMVDALFRAISQDVGDAEKGYAIEWWYENRDDLAQAETPLRHPVFGGAETSAEASGAPEVLSRL